MGELGSIGSGHALVAQVLLNKVRSCRFRFGHGRTAQVVLGLSNLWRCHSPKHNTQNLETKLQKSFKCWRVYVTCHALFLYSLHLKHVTSDSPRHAVMAKDSVSLVVGNYSSLTDHSAGVASYHHGSRQLAAIHCRQSAVPRSLFAMEQNRIWSLRNILD